MVLRRLISLAIISCLSGGVVAAIPARAEAAATPLPSNASVYMPGHGWGHGRGMGQWGANGMARSGSTYRSILTHYYSGIAFAARPSGENIRVLVEASPDVIVTSDSAFTIKWSSGTRIATSDATNKFWRVRFDGSTYLIDRSSSWKGPWSAVTSGTQFVVFAPGTAKLELVFGSGTTRIYRGTIIARYYTGDGMRAINDLPFENYLYGSVPHESPASWPAEELKAQAVAARTYAAYKKDASRANGTMFDICATTACQVYYGFASRSAPGGTVTAQEYSSTNAAVDGTKGQVITYGGKPILAEYSSSTGGYSAPGNVAYQKAVPDAGDTVSPHHDWAGVISAADVERRWPEIGRLVDIRVISRNGYGDWGGRVRSIEIAGSSSTITVGGGTWTSAFGWPSRSRGLQSTWFDLRYWRAEAVELPSSISMLSGGATTVVARLKNTGNQAWAVGGPVRVTAAAGSPFASPQWVSSTRPASVAKNLTVPSKSSVAPGEVAEFRIPLSASGLAPGNYTQRFGSIVDGYSILAPAFTLAVQVLPSWTDEAPDVLLNSSFEYGISGWKTSGFTTADGVVRTTSRDGAALLRIAGGTKSASQTITLAGGRGRRFVLGGWSRSSGTDAAGRAPELDLVATYTDGTATSVRVPFGAAAHPWEYAETTLTTSTEKTLATIRTTIAVVRQTGSIDFDALRVVESPIANPSFENGLSGWGATGFTTGDGVVTSVARDGAKALAMSSAGATSLTQVIPVSGRRSERFVLSAWSKTAGTDPNGGTMQMSVTFTDAAGATAVATMALPKAEHEWQMTAASVSAPINFESATIAISRAGQTGTLYVDEVRIARSWSANPWLEGTLDPWRAIGSGVTLGLPALDGSAGVTLKGSGAQAIRQAVALRGGAGKALVVAGWSRAIGTDPRKGFLGVKLVFHNTDDTLSTVAVPFLASSHQWLYEEHVARAPKGFTAVDIVALTWDQPGTTSFDGVSFRSA